ncbi:hypothetical protein IFM89_033400 [Coptis chinensis]|uniref:Retrotransposon gag domain-containing protein n=1 Tax=Coptis chinensis TaxID=261450 RepID=A0A835LT52_9MAGN|nr:hypothetical protein IFM89_033400 [Coptis chinensis]
MQRLLAKLDDPNQNSFNPNSSNTNPIQQRQHQQPIIQDRPLRLDFPRFEGEDPESWLFQAEQFFTLNPISKEQKVIMASIHLKGDAIAWYRWLNQSLDELTWRQFSTSLCKRFGSKKHIDPMSSLSKLTQQGTVREYITSFETLINLVPGIQDQHQVSLFVSGLKAEIQAGVRIHNPLSLSHGTMRSTTMRAIVYCKSKPLSVLMDSGSTHSFIHPSVVPSCGLSITQKQTFAVMIANGGFLQCHGSCLNVISTFKVTYSLQISVF